MSPSSFVDAVEIDRECRHLDSIVPSFATKAANTGALTGYISDGMSFSSSLTYLLFSIAALLCVIVVCLFLPSEKEYG